jgi:tRNA dimethylallyltransferase
MSLNIDTLTKSLVFPFLKSSSKPLIVILGPTASGKSALAISLAETIRRAEILNADSRQLYKHLDIGTAKIIKEEMHDIPHHLMDVLDPKEEATAAWFKTEAEKVIAEIHARGNIPIMVGGSMLYISAVIDNLQFPSVADSGRRKELETEYDNDGGETLYRLIEKLDPETATQFHKNNKPYVIRAAEILESEGKPSKKRTKLSSPYDQLIIGLDVPRNMLAKRINDRTEKLFQAGWMDEVRTLLESGYIADDPGMKSVGYREIANAISNGEWRMENEKSHKHLIETIAAKTRHYAKRQETWWRKDKRIRWISNDGQVIW